MSSVGGSGLKKLWRLARMLLTMAAMCLMSACYVGKARVVYITSTPVAIAQAMVAATPASVALALSPPPTNAPLPTLNPISSTPTTEALSEYAVQAGDTLSDIAARFRTTMAILIDINQLSNPNMLFVGQILKLPGPPRETTPAVKTLPNAALIRGPASGNFDLAGFIAQLPGYLRDYYELWVYGAAAGGVNSETRSAAQIIESVSLEYSIDTRILLTLLEYQGRWLSDALPDANRLSQPIFTGSAPPKGLYHQLSLAADWLNRGYYGWKYGSLTSLAALSGERYRIAPGLNAASVALQSLYSQINPAPRWQQDVSSEGFVRHYQAYFGDPFARTDDKTIPSHLKQPTLILPFARGETWYFTGGPHNGWGRNSTWGALDFAPPDAGQNYSSCFVSEFPVRAMADGQVVYSDAGLVLQDLDSDGDPGTGWLLLYLHMSAEGRVAIGSQLSAEDVIGYPSCEGGFSSATHVHIARRYNGEWIPADCQNCPATLDIPPFTLGGWRAESVPYREYQGRLVRDDEARVAEQGRNNPINQISW